MQRNQHGAGSRDLRCSALHGTDIQIYGKLLLKRFVLDTL